VTPLKTKKEKCVRNRLNCNCVVQGMIEKLFCYPIIVIVMVTRSGGTGKQTKTDQIEQKNCRKRICNTLKN